MPFYILVSHAHADFSQYYVLLSFWTRSNSKCGAFYWKMFGLSLVWWQLKQDSSRFINFIFVMRILPLGLFPVRLRHLHGKSCSRSILLVQLMVQARLGCWSGGKVQLGALCTALPLSSHSLVAVYRTWVYLLVIHTTFLCVGRINSIYFSIGKSFLF